jgi:P22 coat protein - gene protein 5
MVTNDAVIVLENNLTIAKFIDRSYEPQFGREGEKVGSTIQVRKPPRFLGRTGPALSIEDEYETSVPLTLTTQFGVDIQFTSQEMALQIQDFRERILVPIMATISNRIDKDVCGLFSSVWNLVGTAGVTPANQQVVLLAGQKLNEMGAPIDDNRACVLGSAANAGLVNGLVGLFNPMGKISDNYDTGNMGNALGFKFSLDQNIQLQSNGVLGGAPTVNGANQGISSGWAASTNLVTNNWTAAAAQRLNGGEILTLAGSNAVNPQNRASTNSLQQFVVNAPASSDGAGNMTINISPAIIFGGAFQNVSAAPTTTGAVTVTGAASTSFPQNLAFHKNFGTLAMADLPLPGGVDFAKRAEYRGFRIRVVRAYDINGDRMPLRTDVLYGTKALLPEIAVRITG